MEREASLADLPLAYSLQEFGMHTCPSGAELDTPRESPLNSEFNSPGLLPSSVEKLGRKTKSLIRHDSLKESKVLMVTDMRRTESVLQPDLFKYHDHFEFLSIVGKTKNSEVFHVKHRENGAEFAVKRSRKRFRSKLQRERSMREIRAVAALQKHENIVTLYRAWQEGGHFYIQMDYCEGGSLNQLLNPTPRGAVPLEVDALWGVAADIARGLDFLHSNEVLHLDIKPDNIYRNLNADGTPGPWRIGDFGLAVARDSWGEGWEEGDGDYVAPELLRVGCEPSPAADVFSFGATLFECATGKKLPRKETSAEAADVEMQGVPHPMVFLIKAMLRTDPESRPTAARIAAYAAAYSNVDSTPAAAAVPATTPTGKEVQQKGAAEGSAVKPVRRWAPSLSPLNSEGALTPGAASGLLGFTPPAAAAANAAAAAQLADPSPPNAAGATCRPPAPRPPPLRLPPRPASGNNTHRSASDTGRTIDTCPSSFRIRRRDVDSPGSELMESASESERRSFSCDTERSVSDMEFPDTARPTARTIVRRAKGILAALDMHASTEWGDGGSSGSGAKASPRAHPVNVNDGSMTARAGALTQRSLESSPLSGNVSSRSWGGIPRFPMLDAMPSMQLADAITAAAAAGAKPNSARERPPGSSSQKRVVVASKDLSPRPIVSPFESGAVVIPGAAPPPSGNALVPPLQLPNHPPTSLRRKRHHSSRRALVNALKEEELSSSRSAEMCSSRSFQELQPQRKGARFEEDKEEKLMVEVQGPLSPHSGPPSQRSARGARSARLARFSPARQVPCTAAVAMAQMKTMNLDDEGV